MTLHLDQNLYDALCVKIYFSEGVSSLSRNRHESVSGIYTRFNRHDPENMRVMCVMRGVRYLAVCWCQQLSDNVVCLYN